MNYLSLYGNDLFDLLNCIVIVGECAGLQSQEIKALREQLRLSQPVFARYLNTSVSTVQKWETGVKRPGGVSLKLLSIVRKHGLQVLL
ncbi:DNA-binding protein [Serratia marcescens]|nr:DNA-binding protein [Serratia marcescens]